MTRNPLGVNEKNNNNSTNRQEVPLCICWLTLPGQGAVLLQTLDSLKGPLQCVPKDETHILVRTCDP